MASPDSIFSAGDLRQASLLSFLRHLLRTNKPKSVEDLLMEYGRMFPPTGNLRDGFESSQVTIERVVEFLEELEERSLVAREGAKYGITDLGRRIAAKSSAKSK